MKKNTRNKARERTKKLHIQSTGKGLTSQAGFFTGQLLDFLESKGHGYLIKVKLKNLTELMGKQVWTPIANHSGWEQCQFEHQCVGWKKGRRFVAVRIEKEVKKDKQQELFESKFYDYWLFSRISG